MTDVFLVQYATADGRHGLALDRDGSLRALPYSLDWVLSGEIPASTLIETLTNDATDVIDAASITLAAPVGTQEVWAAGVTYKRSEEAREAESNNSTIYTRVYDAKRPELFFKSLGTDVVALGDPVGIRYDATWNVPEAELAVVVNARMEVVGFTIGNDMSSRDIEGENPLYLPQAKVYDGACAIGPRIWLRPDATHWPDATIRVRIERAGQTLFDDYTTTAEIHRPMAELVEYLGRCKRFRRGAMLLTGTGVVPDDTFTLEAGDVVSIRIDPIGELVNTVRVVGKQEWA